MKWRKKKLYRGKGNLLLLVIAFLACHPQRGSAFAFAFAFAVAVAVAVAVAAACHSERSEEPPHFARSATTAS